MLSIVGYMQGVLSCRDYSHWLHLTQDRCLAGPWWLACPRHRRQAQLQKSGIPSSVLVFLQSDFAEH